MDREGMNRGSAMNLGVEKYESVKIKTWTGGLKVLV
jgi:hypothetical protein